MFEQLDGVKLLRKLYLQIVYFPNTKHSTVSIWNTYIHTHLIELQSDVCIETK